MIESGNVSISVQGITTWKGTEQIIHQIINRQGIQNIFLFFDADILGKYMLFLQSTKMAHMLEELFPFIRIRYAFWKKSYGKGIDDCINAGYKNKISYLNIEQAEKICGNVFLGALKKYRIGKIQELPKSKVEDSENYLQSTSELILGLQ